MSGLLVPSIIVLVIGLLFCLIALFTCLHAKNAYENFKPKEPRQAWETVHEERKRTTKHTEEHRTKKS